MSRELQNIPFYWTAIAHWLGILVYGLLLPARLRRGQTAAAGIVSLGVLCLFMYVTEPQTGALFNAMMAVFAALTTLPLALVCRLQVRHVLYYAARSFILGGFACSLAWQLYIFCAQRWPVFSPAWAQAVFVLLVFLLVFSVMYLLERPWKRVDAELHLSSTSCASTLAIAVLIYILSSLSFAPIDTPFAGSTYAEAFNIRTLVYLGGVAVLFAHHVALCDAYVMLERDTLEQMLQMQYMNYRLNQESVDLVNRKYHDLKHQIAVLRSQIGTAQKLDYLDRMEREIAVYETQNKTGNRFLDTILSGKSIHCQNEGIKLTCVADGAALDFMDVVDLSVLFGNALDNAIEAVSQIPQTEQRLIHLSVSRERGFLRIRLENRFQGRLRLSRGLPVTTKADERYHGFGVRSIVNTAEKYGGSATFTQRDGWFELRILIPIPQ